MYDFYKDGEELGFYLSNCKYLPFLQAFVSQVGYSPYFKCYLYLKLYC